MNICCMKFINSLLFIYQVNIKCNDNNIMFTCDTYNSNDVYNKKHLIAQKIWKKNDHFLLNWHVYVDKQSISKFII